MSELKGRRVLVTGATAGIGKETARALAAKGASVSIVGRNPQKTQGVVDELKQRTGNLDIDCFIADLSSMAQVRALAGEVLARHPALQVLVNNAGGVNPQRVVTADGYELTFAMNHLAYFLLTNLLLPALERGGPARIVSVASEAHRLGAPLDFDDLMATKGYSMFPVYGRSKLANILFTRELARRLAGKPVTATCLHPGTVNSDFMAKPGFWGVAGKVAGLFMKTVEEGARTSVYLASSPEVQGQSGGYYDDSKLRRLSKAAQDDAAAARLWEVSAALTGLSAQG